MGGLSKARAVLTKARLKNAHNPDLWLAAIRLEAQAWNKTEADSLMAKALQDCPSSGCLWALIWLHDLKHKFKSVDASQRCDVDPFVFASVAI